MRKILLHLIIFVSVCSCTQEIDSAYDMVIADVNLIDGTGKPLQENVNVYIKDSLIVKLDSIDLSDFDAKSKIDGNGKYLIPGLIDGHTHPGDIRENFPKFIHYGVTGIFVTGCRNCSNEHFKEMKALAAIDSIPAPKVYHTSQIFTMEGRHPVKTYGSSGWINEETVFLLKDTLQIEAYVKQVAAYPIVGIKLIIEEGPDPPFVTRIPQEFVTKVVKEAKRYSLEVFAHVSDMGEVIMAEKAGVQNIVHFFGVEIIPERDKDIIERLGKKKISWVTTLSLGKSFFYPLHPEWLDNQDLIVAYPLEHTKAMITPERIQFAKETYDYVEKVLGIPNPDLENTSIPQVDDIKLLIEKGCNVVVGTDTYNKFIFPGYSMHEEMQLLEMGGLAPLDIITMSTKNGAKMLGVLDKTGTVEIGKYADLILLDKNPLETIVNTLKINTVFKNGSIQSRLILQD